MKRSKQIIKAKLPKCETTGKVRFYDEIGAKLALAARFNRGKGEQRIYRCEFCNEWHLTSKALRGKPKL